MSEKPIRDIIGTKVVGQHGREVGVVRGAQIDTDSWRLVALRVKLDKGVLDDLSFRRSLLRGPSINIPADQISGISDVIVLKVPLGELKPEGQEGEGGAGPSADAE